MHRIVFTAMSLLALSMIAAAPRQSLQQTCENVTISSPVEGDAIRGKTEILGSASINEFLFYKVEYSTSANPERWIAVSTTYPVRVINGRLDVWNTTTVRDGVYNLKLTVVDQRSQEVCRVTVRQLQVVNRITPTSTPSPTETPKPLPTLPVASTPGVRGMAAQITATTVPGITRTPTPSPTRSGPGLPGLPKGEDVVRALELSKIWEAFFLGVGMSLAIFVLLGLVTLVRRLL